MALLFPNSLRPAVLACLAGVKERVGYVCYGRGPLLTGKVYPRRAGGRVADGGADTRPGGGPAHHDAALQRRAQHEHTPRPSAVMAAQHVQGMAAGDGRQAIMPDELGCAQPARQMLTAGQVELLKQVFFKLAQILRRVGLGRLWRQIGSGDGSPSGDYTRYSIRIIHHKPPLDIFRFIG